MSAQLEALADELESEYLLGHYDVIVRRGREVLNASVEYSDQLALARIARAVGQTYTILSHYNDALNVLTISLAAARESRQSEQSCLTLIALAYVEAQLGMNEAQEHYREALRLARNEGSNSLQGRAFYGLANLCALRGEYAQSRNFLSHAPEIMQRAIHDAEKHAKAFEIRAANYESHGLTTKAAQFRKQAAKIRHQYEEDRQTWMDMVVRYGDLLLIDNAYKDAERFFHKVVVTPSDAGGVVQRGRAYEGLGNVALYRGSKMGQDAASSALFDQAETHYRRAIAYFRQEGGSDLIWSPYTRLGDLYNTWLDRKEEAFDAYKKAIDALEETRRELPWDDRARVGFAERRTAPYARLVELLCRLPEKRIAQMQVVSRWGYAFKVVEQARSRALLDLLGSQMDNRTEPIGLAEVRKCLAGGPS
jgi:tetratricopeptide (TPR) repeat protein